MLKINRIVRALALVLMVAALCFAFYEVGIRVGESKVKVQIVEKEKEVIRYVEKKKADIMAKPNAGRDELVGLFNAGIL
nr:MAG TPA: hypothetical protein [Caudoviricetes sp.]